MAVFVLNLLRGLELNQGLEVLLFAHFHECMDYPIFLDLNILRNSPL